MVTKLRTNDTVHRALLRQIEVHRTKLRELRSSGADVGKELDEFILSNFDPEVLLSSNGHQLDDFFSDDEINER